MKKKEITYNDTVKEAITLALLQLNKKKDFHQISISEIVKLAGVSRSSFYRNFETKEQVLVLYIQEKYKESFAKELLALANDEPIDVQHFLLKRLRFIRENSDYFTLLRKSNLLEYVFANIDSGLSHFLSGNVTLHSPYYSLYFLAK